MNPLALNDTSRYVMSVEHKLLAYKKITQAQCKGTPLIATAVFVLFIAVAALLLGALFLGHPEDFSNIVTEVLLPFIFLSAAAICFIALPTFMYGLRYHQVAKSEHKLLAESNSNELQQYCESLKMQEMTEKQLVAFVENTMLCKEFTRLFSSATLTQTIQKIQKEKHSHKDQIVKALEKVKSQIFMSEYQKEKLAKKEEKERK